MNKNKYRQYFYMNMIKNISSAKKLFKCHENKCDYSYHYFSFI